MFCRRPSHNHIPVSNLALKFNQVGRCIADTSTDLISHMVALMYADDLALLADSADDLVVLLGTVDTIPSKYGLLINAAKTEVMVVGRPMTWPTWKLSIKELLATDTFKYFGVFLWDYGPTTACSPQHSPKP
eukprot:363357-Chlamydomonas_euryale.AAC.19